MNDPDWNSEIDAIEKLDNGGMVIEQATELMMKAGIYSYYDLLFSLIKAGILKPDGNPTDFALNNGLAAQIEVKPMNKDDETTGDENIDKSIHDDSDIHHDLHDNLKKDINELQNNVIKLESKMKKRKKANKELDNKIDKAMMWVFFSIVGAGVLGALAGLLVRFL